MATRTQTDGLSGGTSGEERSENTSQSGGAFGGVADSAKQAASQAKEAAGNVVEQVKTQAASQADQQRHTLASGIGSVAQAFRNMGEQLRTQDQGPVAGYAADLGNSISGKMEQLAEQLHQRDVRQLAGDVENFARRSPAMFLGIAFVVGFAASRFLKSSRPAQYPDPLANIPDPNRALPPASSSQDF